RPLSALSGFRAVLTTSLLQTSGARSSATVVGTPAVLSSSAAQRARSVAPASRSVTADGPKPAWRTRPNPSRVAPWEVTPARIRSRPSTAASASALPSPFWSVRTQLIGPRAGRSDLAAAPVEYD